MGRYIEFIKKNSFLFEELVKRDFKKKYKRTVLGMFWSMLSPLMTLLVMALVFTKFFGRDTPHYIIYLFAGNLIFSYFKESTTGGMGALVSNSGIISKVNVPKYLFVFAKNVSVLINFLLTLAIFFIFALFDGVDFGLHLITLIYPVICLLIFNLGMGLILSAMYVVFKDIQYLYDIFSMLLMYLSAIFYTVDIFEPTIQKLFYLNPLYCFISYFRTVVIDGVYASVELNLLCLFYAMASMIIGSWVYKKYNYRFIYYM